MQAQIFPRGTYAPTMGVFNIPQDPRALAENVHALFGAPVTTKSKEPRFKASNHFTQSISSTSSRSSSPPSSQNSHLSSDESEISEEEESSAYHPSVSEKLSRAFKNLRKIGK